MNHVARLFHDARREQDCQSSRSAFRTDLKKQPKQIRLLQRLESGRYLFPKTASLERFVAILGIDLADVVQAMRVSVAEALRCGVRCWRLGTPRSLGGSRVLGAHARALNGGAHRKPREFMAPFSSAKRAST